MLKSSFETIRFCYRNLIQPSSSILKKQNRDPWEDRVQDCNKRLSMNKQIKAFSTVFKGNLALYRRRLSSFLKWCHNRLLNRPLKRGINFQYTRNNNKHKKEIKKKGPGTAKFFHMCFNTSNKSVSGVGYRCSKK